MVRAGLDSRRRRDSRTNVVRGWQATGLAIGLAGLALALTCVLAFTFVGRGTPAPFDPPRRLVMRGPYRLVRNPMYLGDYDEYCQRTGRWWPFRTAPHERM